MSSIRISPLDDASWPEELQPVAARLGQHYLGLVNLHRTLARNPGQFRPFLAFASRILKSSLDDRTREILILRTAWARGVPYEWAHHVIVGRAAGLSDIEIAAIKKRPEEGDWSEAERALLAATDTLVAESHLSDALWERLARDHGEVQLMDIVMTVGVYTMLGMALNAFGVPLDAGLAEIAAADEIGTRDMSGPAVRTARH